MTIIPDQATTDAERAAAELADQLATDIERYAAFIRANPDIAKKLGSERRFLLYLMPGGEAKQKMADIVRAAKAAGATVTKTISEEYAGANLSFGHVSLEVYAHREVVCERRVTGTREIEVEEQDPEALAKVPTRTVTKTVEDVEWVCTPILQADPADTAEAGAAS